MKEKNNDTMSSRFSGPEAIASCRRMTGSEMSESGRSTTFLSFPRRRESIATQSGRSMVEMLGVLAIVGVLSVGAIGGYSYAMDKYRANQTIQDIQLRAGDVLAQVNTAHTVNLLQWPTTSTVGYPIGYDEEGGGILVSKVPERVCDMIFQELVPEVIVVINGQSYIAYESVCAEDNTMKFMYGTSKEDYNPCPSGASKDGKGGYATTIDGTECYCNTADTIYKNGSCYNPCIEGTSQDGLGGLVSTTSGISCYCNEIDTIYKNKECQPKPEGCTKNAECNRGEYCNVVYTGTEECVSWSTTLSGTCRVAADDLASKPDSAPFYISTQKMLWQAAKNFCSALGKKSVTLSDFECGSTFCSSGCDYTVGSCKKENSTAVSDVVAAMGAYSSFYGWTSTQYSSCYGYAVDKRGGYVGNPRKLNSLVATCKDG